MGSRQFSCGFGPLRVEKVNSGLDPWFITGFTDAEGCFRVSVSSDKSSRIGYSTKICYNITLHSRDLFILELIKSYFGGAGNISVQQTSNRCYYEVKSLEEIIKYILPHFDQYPLISNKLADYMLFKEIVLIIRDKGHLTELGLQEIMNRRATLNFGLSCASTD